MTWDQYYGMEMGYPCRQTEGQTPVKTFPSGCTTYAAGNKLLDQSLSSVYNNMYECLVYIVPGSSVSVGDIVLGENSSGSQAGWHNVENKVNTPPPPPKKKIWDFGYRQFSTQESQSKNPALPPPPPSTLDNVMLNQWSWKN